MSYDQITGIDRQAWAASEFSAGASGNWFGLVVGLKESLDFFLNTLMLGFFQILGTITL